MILRIRIPWWVAHGGAVHLNGQPLGGFAGPSGYLAISRVWKQGDRVEVHLPMSLYVESMPDDATIAAVLYGPVVLAGEMGRPIRPKSLCLGRWDPPSRQMRIRSLFCAVMLARPETWLKPDPQKALTFQTAGLEREFTLSPLYKIFDQRYTVYWKMQAPNAQA